MHITELILKIFWAAAIILCADAAWAQELTEAQVFEWWDDGIVSGEEAQEMLDLLQEGNVHEACLLAEVYALESCSEVSDSQLLREHNARQRQLVKELITAERESVRASETASRNRTANSSKSQEGVLNKVKGYVSWKGRADSLGQLESHHTELLVEFYKFSLRLGSQELLTYRSGGAEAYFGDISTKEFHSFIPLDTLWGATLLYPIWIFRGGVALDTAGNVQGLLGIAPDKSASLQLAYWRKLVNLGNLRESPEQSLALQTKFKSEWGLGDAAAWWIPGRNTPLVKVQLQNQGNFGPEPLSRTRFAWKTTAYFHGDSVPSQAHLTATLQRHKFWGSQTIAASLGDSWKSKLTANARVMIPLASDSTKARLKVAAQSGPRFLRGDLSATCLEASENCRKGDWKLKLTAPFAPLDQSAPGNLTATASIQSRHTRDQGFDTPRLELGAAYQPFPQNFARLAVQFPKGNPQKHTQIRSEVSVTTLERRLSCTLSATFRQKEGQKLHPVHGFFQGKWRF